MTKASLAGGAVAAVLLLIGFAASFRALRPDGERAAAGPGDPAGSAAPVSPSPEDGRGSAADARGFLSGRVTTEDGETYEGRLRWGGGEEAFWGDYFNGEKDENPWTAHVPPERLVRHRPIKVFGLEILNREEPVSVRRLFMARFGDLARLEASVRQVRVTLKSGTEHVLDRFEAGDFDDGVRVWDLARGVVDLETRTIRTIELLPAIAAGAADDLPARLHGTVRTRGGDFTGFVQWNREESVATDELDGRTADGELAVPFGTIRSIARDGDDGVRVTLLDGGELVLSGSREVGDGHRGLYVDDPRYGRVLVSWDAFERIDFSDHDDLRQLGSGPGYDDFPPGVPLTGSVTTRDGRRLEGRLVYDLDESETTETLDAPAGGVDYTIPFGLVAAIVLPPSTEGDDPHARLTLQGGEELRLELAGDLGARNLGLLVFAGPGPGDEGGERVEHVPWADVERIDFARPPAMYPPLGGR